TVNLNISVNLTVHTLQVMRLATTEERIFKMFLVVGIHMVFIYINLAMLFTLWSKPSFRHTARYILFAHMLFNDTIHLTITLTLYMLGNFHLFVVRVACAFMVLLSSCTFVNAPLNLAVMSLERYTAVCFPLRHSELATPRRTQLAVGLVWALGVINVLIDVCALFLTEPSFFLSPVLCTIEHLQTAGWQQEKGVGFNAFCFVAVSLIIIYTYIAIIVTARSASDKTKASKAHKTVLLHLVQLGLSLSSFLYTPIESALASVGSTTIFIDLRYLNFLFLIILPRCLSPLIYGLRDDAVRPLFLHYLTCRTRKVKAAVMVQ
uniref:G-protein coupled receptors family 1 profile domain-containing protein n=1 Tax=Oncorhynchus mykiss TaxID=8022 RepID=A0A8C7WK23_ONCMY